MALAPARSWEEKRINTAYLKQMSSEIGRLSREIEANPKSAKAYFDRGCIYQSTNMFSQAVKDFSQTLKLKPESNAYRRRGICYCLMGDYEKCIEDTTRCINLEPKDAGAFQWRGYAHDQLNEDKAAFADLNRSINLMPDKGAYRTRGCIEVFGGKFKQGIADLTQAIKIKRADAAAFYFRGLAYYNLERYEEALSQFTESLAVKQEGQVYYYRARTFMILGRTDDALKDFEAASNFTNQFSSEELAGNIASSVMQLKPGNLDRKTLRLTRQTKHVSQLVENSLLRSSEQNYEAAEKKLTKAIAISPDDFTLYSMRAAVYAAKRDWKKALKDYTRSLFYENINIDAYLARAGVYAELCQPEKAELDLKRAVVLDPKMAVTHYKRAQVLERLKKKSDASAAYREFLRLYAGARDNALEPLAKTARERLSKS